MEADDAVEEGAGYHRRRVWVARHDEVGVLGETVYHRQNNRLPAHIC